MKAGWTEYNNLAVGAGDSLLVCVDPHQHEFKLGWAKLQTLWRSLSSLPPSESNVAEFHRSLDQIEAAGYQMGDFRIPENVMERRITRFQGPAARAILSRHGETQPPSYSQERFAPPELFNTQVESAYTYVRDLMNKETMSTESTEHSSGPPSTPEGRVMDVMKSSVFPLTMLAAIRENFGWSAVLWIVVGLIIAAILIWTVP